MVKKATYEELEQRVRELEKKLAKFEQSEEKFTENEEKYRIIAENSVDVIWTSDLDSRYTFVTPSVQRLFGYTPQEVIGAKYSDHLPHDEQEIVKQTIAEVYAKGFRGASDSFPFCLELRQIRKDGSMFWSEVLVSPLFNEAGELIGFQGSTRDISERKNIEERLKQISFRDSLTSLYNRNFFQEEMNRLQDGRYNPIGIIVCDINGLKLINDTLGHNKGDQLLKAAVDILRRCFRTSDIIARIGGDEFAVLLPQSSEEIVKTCCNRIRNEVKHYNEQHSEFGLSIAIGYAVQYKPHVDMHVLFKRADDAMYKEKLQQSYSSRSEIVQALIKTLEARDYITEGHAGRLHTYTQHLGNSLGLSEERLNDLQLLARFHDLGKVGVPDRILFKPGPLTEEEYEEMKRHCEIGYRIALSIPDLVPIADFILKHHEWWDGQGYPLGLQDRDIPLECRILSIVDAYDTMTSKRPYKNAITHQEAVNELWRCADTQFDPELVERFIQVIEESE